LTERHPTRGWAFTPGAAETVVVEGSEIPVAINAHGLRDVPHAYDPRPGSFRIVVLGDSFMEAWGVELADSMPRRLEQGLSSKNAEVMNLGVRGYGTAQEYLSLKEEGMQYHPDLVVLLLRRQRPAQQPGRARGEHAEGPHAAVLWQTLRAPGFFWAELRLPRRPARRGLHRTP
jgi:hypothetical protein